MCNTYTYLNFSVASNALSLLRKEKFLHNEAPKQVSQRSCWCPIPGSAQDQVGWGSEQPGLMRGVSANGWGLEQDDL